MKFYADSADLAAVLPLVRDGLVAGVTSNPAIVVRDGHTTGDRPRLYAEFDHAGSREILMQAVGAGFDSMLADAMDLAALGSRMVVKVPATAVGFRVGAVLSGSGVPVLITAVYSLAQAAFAASIGAQYIAPYFGRLLDSGEDAVQLIAQMERAMRGTGTEVLVASVRSTSAAERLIDAGVTHLTADTPVLSAMMSHSVSDSSAEEFERIARRPEERPGSRAGHGQQ